MLFFFFSERSSPLSYYARVCCACKTLIPDTEWGWFFSFHTVRLCGWFVVLCVERGVAKRNARLRCLAAWPQEGCCSAHTRGGSNAAPRWGRRPAPPRLRTAAGNAPGRGAMAPPRGRRWSVRGCAGQALFCESGCEARSLLWVAFQTLLSEC